MGGAILRKSLIQFSVDGWGCVPSLSFDLMPNYGGGNEDNGTSFERSHDALLHSAPLTLLTRTSTGDTQTLKGRSGSVYVGSPGGRKVLFEPFKHLWQVWGLILNVISLLLPSLWCFSFAFGCGVVFCSGIQHSPLSGYLAVSCNFGVLAGEDERMSFYSAIWSGITRLVCVNYLLVS